ncbi:type 1 fimbrial protein [Citrobacter sp. Awk 4]|uniref:fimbrial protein n=1 Tax=Citrobacter sp. Awk 4 TaxID=2963955 RepID=UPI002304C91A|nr:fimbrial protein [Citrobacter sp. Awk 4]MDA8480760.1 type 1 fimbrial protein [Citrobacter sp. Awk 4]
MLLSSVAIAGNRANVTLPGGDMRFQGEIIAEACRVEARDRELIVPMGQISSNWFHALGQDAGPVPFDIHLQECTTVVSQRVGVAFLGVADGKNPDVLSAGDVPEVAKGVGVALFDNQGNLIPVNSQQQAWTYLSEGEEPEVLHFTAKYRSTSQHVVGGPVNAHAWFALTYE